MSMSAQQSPERDLALARSSTRDGSMRDGSMRAGSIQQRTSHDSPLQESLSQRLVVLREITGLGRGRLGDELLDQITMVVDRAGQRMRLAGGHTVVALAGSTGSGKSSLFNALTGQDWAAVGVRRPTTATTSAAVWGSLDSAAPLLDWLGVSSRYQVGYDQQHDDQQNNQHHDLPGLVLLDLPDHDSQAQSHRMEVDRLVGLVDLLIWVVDPQKYADDALHSSYLRPLATHDAVTVVVLNHIDTLGPDQARECLTDVTRLVREDGLPAATVLGVSARTGAGLPALQAHLHDALERHEAIAARISADIDQLATSLNHYTLLDQGGQQSQARSKRGGASAALGSPVRLGKPERSAVVHALSQAAGVPAVCDAVAGSYLHQARQHTGWPVTRWLRSLRPDPLRSWLTSPASQQGMDAGKAVESDAVIVKTNNKTNKTTNSPTRDPVTSAARSQVELAVRELVDTQTSHVPGWQRQAVRRRLGLDPSADAAQGANTVNELMVALQHAVGSTSSTLARTPRWWSAINAGQWVMVLVLLLGLVWLAALFALAWFKIPDPPTPDLGPLPVPTVLVVAGLVGALLLSVKARVLARIGARRAARRTANRLEDQIAQAGETYLFAPLRNEMDTYTLLLKRLNELG